LWLGHTTEEQTPVGRDASLLEREPAQAAVVDAVEAARKGAGATVFVEGTAGLGKTSVLAWSRAVARDAGFIVASAVGSPTEARLPFGLFGQAMMALGGSAVDDVAELAQLGGQPARLYRTFQFLVEVAEQAPLLLTLDDLHWADADSLELLGFICRRLGGSRVLALGALRPEPNAASALAEELVGSGHATILALAPLSPKAAAKLLTTLAPVGVAEHERVIESCAGSPLLLRVAASALSGGASLPVARAFGSSLLLERFVGLGAAAFAFVRAAAILGVRFKPALAGELAGLQEPEWRAAVVQLARAGLVDDLGGGTAAFVHPLFAQALTDDLQRSERELAHARAFRVLLARGEPEAVAVEHALAGGLTGDPLAVEAAARAGRGALEQGALAAARDLLGSAAKLSGDDPPVELLLDYAAALAASGEVQRARDVIEQLRARVDVEPAVWGRALALLARAEAVAGQPSEAERLYSEAAAVCSVIPAIQAEVLADAALTCHVTSPMSWVLETTTRALALFAGDEPMRRELRILRAYARTMSGDPAEIELLEGEVRGWLDTGRGGDQSWAWTRAVHSLNLFKLLEDPGWATAVFEREFPRAVEVGAPILINALSIAYADAIHRLGRLREAHDLMQNAWAVSGLRMSPWYEVGMSVTLTELGREREAQPYVEVLRTVKASTPPEYYAAARMWLDVIDARRLLAGGEPEAASDAILDAEAVTERSGWRHPLLVPWAGTGIQAHLAAERPDCARSAMEDLDRLARPLSCRWPRAMLALGRAQLAAFEGRDQEAERGFEEGLAILEQLPFPLERAEALLVYGRYLRRAGRPRAARAPLARALGLAEHSSAERIARSVRAELSAAGGRRRRRDEDRSALTAQERRVFELAASGLSNAQIAAALTVSPKTVDNHLQRIYAKLGIHSRRELIRRGATGDTPPSPPAPR
jgi:DNA-binding CsgD family transcriptional regulator